MDFIYMVNKETKAEHRFPDQEGVVAYFEARGWKVTDPPEDKPFVSQTLDIEPEDKWVTLVHKKTHATHEFPNHPEAIEGAYESGWELPKVADEEKSKKAPAKKTASAKSADDTEKVNS